MLVDPGKLTMNFDPPTSPLVGSTDQHAEGVLTVTLTAAPPTQGPGEHEGTEYNIHQPREKGRYMCQFVGQKAHDFHVIIVT